MLCKMALSVQIGPGVAPSSTPHGDSVDRDSPAVASGKIREIVDVLESSLLPMPAARPLTMIFLGCGAGATESAVVHELMRRCHTVVRAVFMDQYRSSALDDVMHALCSGTAVRTTYGASYAELLGSMHEWATDTMLVPVGINNNIGVGSADALWDVWRFFVACETLLVWGRRAIVRDYVNLLDNSRGTYDAHTSYYRHGQLAVMRCDWFDYACRFVSGPGAKRLLTITPPPCAPPCLPEAGTDRSPSPSTRRPAE